MTIRYKLAFTIDSKTLFGIMAKFLPIEDLSVEEVPMEERVNAKMRALAVSIPKLKPKRKLRSRAPRRTGHKINLHAGVNAILLTFLQDGMPHELVRVFPAVKAAGYATSGMYSRIERLQRHGYIERIATGRYQITQKGKQTMEQPNG
jgi:hypothetical protein